MPSLSARAARSSGSTSARLSRSDGRAAPPKDRYSDDEDYWDDKERQKNRSRHTSDDDDDYDGHDDSDDHDSYSDDDADSDDATPSSSASRSSNAYETRQRAIPLLPTGRRHRSPVRTTRPNGTYRSRRFGPLRFYRLPNRTGRYIGLIIIAAITIFILSLIRASQVENWKIVNGKIDKKPPPPHAWLSFRLLTRYYGGLDTVTVHEHNVPEYPTVDDQTAEAPKKVLSQAENDEEPETEADVQAAAAQEGEKNAQAKTDEAEGGKRRKRAEGGPNESSRAASKPFIEHPQSVFTLDADSQHNMTECFIDRAKTVRIPPIRYYDGRPRGFPEHAVGSYEALGLPEDICFERFGRFGPYGFGYSVRTGGLGTGQYGEKNGSDAVWESVPVVDYRDLDWADVQQRCYLANAHRFAALEPKPPGSSGWYVHDGLDHVLNGVEDRLKDDPDALVASSNGTVSKRHAAAEQPAAGPTDKPAEKPSEKSGDKSDGKPTDKPSDGPPDANKSSRTAFVVRVWDEYEWKVEDIMNLRSLIVELAMGSGARYDIHLLMQIRDDAKYPVWADRAVYDERINSTVPAEFRSLVTLWSQTQMLSLYQGMHDELPEGMPMHGPYRGLSMAMQYFAQQHPEYDYFWQWEMDARYTGHYLDLLTKIERWAALQPRKGMWERAERFYVPRVHGSWEEFKQMAKIQAEMGTTNSPDKMWKGLGKDKDKEQEQATPPGLIWGPLRAPDEADWFEPENDPVPPTKNPDADNYKWGVGEEADLISLYPLYDPVGTTWWWTDDISGYVSEKSRIPRRCHTIVTSRVSRRLLLAMHRETAHKKHFAFPEMWQATVALQHGYKAVTAPHPMFIDREWPSRFLAQTLNAGRDGASGGARTSVYGFREHNVQGLTWFYNSHFAPLLYKRWLGLRVDDMGGESFEKDVDLSKSGKHVDDMPGGEGRMCLPPMLIHPAKNLVLPVEEAAVVDEEQSKETPESDPTA